MITTHSPAQTRAIWDRGCIAWTLTGPRYGDSPVRAYGAGNQIGTLPNGDRYLISGTPGAWRATYIHRDGTVTDLGTAPDGAWHLCTAHHRRQKREVA